MQSDISMYAIHHSVDNDADDKFVDGDRYGSKAESGSCVSTPRSTAAAVAAGL
jgi:hypothetical protein